MKYIIPIFLLLTAVFAVSISSPEKLELNGNSTFSVTVFGATSGSRLIPTWTNEKVHVFPGYINLNEPSMVPDFYIVSDLGVCGKTNLTFSIGSTKSVTELDFGTCGFFPGEYNTDTSYLGEKMWDLRDEIKHLEYYMLITPEIQDYIDTLYDRIAEANAIDITVSPAEFTRKDMMVHEIEADINKLDLAFRGINPDLTSLLSLGTHT
jgi:hypothetical protein